MANKFKNRNYSETKYEQCGPGFYTGSEEVTFVNCPIFSTRKSEMYHPLPSIPFLPKGCQCYEDDKLIWVS